MPSFGPPGEQSRLASLIKGLLQDMNDYKLFAGISQDRLQKIRRRIAQDLEDDLRRELTPKIRQQLESDFKEKLKQAKEKARQDLEEKRTSPKSIQVFKSYAREVELDATTQALVASSSADKAEVKVGPAKRVYSLWITTFLVCIAATTACVALGANPMLALVSELGMLVSFIMALFLHSRPHQLEEEVRRHRKVSSDYMILADQAKAGRITMENATEKELKSHIESLRRHKDSLDSDYHPRIDEVMQTREQVKVRIQVEDPDYDRELFEEQLAAAEAENRKSKA
jgi:hypothetical protein